MSTYILNFVNILFTPTKNINIVLTLQNVNSIINTKKIIIKLILLEAT